MFRFLGTVNVDIILENGCNLSGNQVYKLTPESLQKMKDIETKIVEWEKGEIDWPWKTITWSEFEQQVYGRELALEEGEET